MFIDQSGLLYGARIGACSDEAQLHFPRLLVASNGFGRIELSYSKLLATVYSKFRKKPSKEDVTRWMHEYRANFLLFVYRAADGSVWGQWDIPNKMLPRFKREEDKRSPEPDANQFHAFRHAYIESRRVAYSEQDDYVDFGSVSEYFGNATEVSQSISECLEDTSETLRKTSARVGVGVGIGIGVGIGVGEERYSCSEPSGSEPSVARLPTNRKDEFFEVTADMVVIWKRLYPAVDVDQQLRNIEGWLDGNPVKRKTHGGVKKFINTWLSDEQNKGGRSSAGGTYGRGNGGSARPNPASARNEQSRKAIRQVFGSFGASASGDAHGADEEFLSGAGDSSGNCRDVGSCVDRSVDFVRNFHDEEGLTATHVGVEVLPPTFRTAGAP